MRHFLLQLSLLLAIFAPSNSNAKTIDVIAIEYPPFSTLGVESGGLSFELLSQNTDENYQWQPYFLPPKRAFANIKSGDWCASLYPTPMAKSFVQYQLSEQTVNIGLVRLKQQDSFEWQDLKQLSGRTVAILSTEGTSPFAIQFAQAGLTKAEVQTVKSGVQMVLLGRVDYAMLDDVSFNALETNNKARLEFSKTNLLSTKLSIFVNPECGIELPHLTVLDQK